jgi:hypothetical protein
MPVPQRTTQFPGTSLRAQAIANSVPLAASVIHRDDVLASPSVAINSAAASPAPSARCRYPLEEASMKKLALWSVAAFAVFLLVAPAASAGGGSFSVNSAAPGVYFTVGGKATGGRDYFAIAVTCDNGYATRIFVTAPGDSQTIYPGTGTCAAELQAAQSINKFRTVDTLTFVVA